VGQRHKSRVGDGTTDLTSNLKTDSIDSCKLRTKSTDRTDRELGFSDNVSDFTNRTDCTKLTDV
jgi:hypothetical protein